MHQMLLSKLKCDKKRMLYLLLFLLCGILLMIFPGEVKEERELQNQDFIGSYSIEKEEQRLEEILSSINGVGECKVLLSIHNSEESILAEDHEETVILSEGGRQSAVTVSTRYPAFQGAIVVSGGCHDASVRYDILSSVMAYTGLDIDKITICPIKTG